VYERVAPPTQEPEPPFGVIAFAAKGGTTLDAITGVTVCWICGASGVCGATIDTSDDAFDGGEDAEI
jgi:hypothetical protein